ncbi:PEPxxWA-CTERM sorting domain-containing protein [Sphingomonas sp. SM33]|uniref:PEPxxWA-CTERM sorting domain-containing protein n=1 Tax=Sphingomonas telluris TaxID=2907998 RepID=A0ABS9VQI0_9SPHN|nr:PEPxxWA-CTERM sorting domain-containing protein [Sphingomonas telluris]MCH8617213.1 PEPxxWA-CTERM sorting domain-containing protein [Sphingomonas telluris]
MPGTTFAQTRRLLLAAVFTCCLPTAGEARRTVIDGNQYGTTYEISTDAEDGDAIVLPFDVNYGSGLQSDVTVTLGPCCLGGVNDPPTVPVGLTFTNSPTDYLFATVLKEQFIDGSVHLSNDQQTSTPLDPVDQASIFDFGMAFLITGGPPQVPGPGTGDLGFYSPFFGDAYVRFSDLSGSGALGDFGLELTCSGICTDIGFNLAGLNFSSALFDPNLAPTQLESYEVGAEGSTFNFVFRNSAAVPEPATWVSMLMGFGLIGVALRRKGRLSSAFR